jgi:hypothetical protein
MYVWPEAVDRPVSGWITMRLTASRSIGATRLTFALSPSKSIQIRLRPGQSRQVRLPVCATSDAHVTYRSNVRAILGLRVVSARATTPVFTPSPAACPSGPGRPQGLAVLATEVVNG